MSKKTYTPKNRGNRPSKRTTKTITKQPNVGWKFYFDYYRKMDYDYLIEGRLNDKALKEVKTANAEKLQSQNEDFWSLDFNTYPKPKLVTDSKNRFELTTTYPGLLVGSGYQHELSSEEALKLGFYFDHTTGLPALPGSGIKGTLRSAFKVENSSEFIQSLLEGIVGTAPMNKTQIKALEEEIFEGKDTSKSTDENTSYLFSSQRDVFYDAVMAASKHPFANSNKKGRFLGGDYITPHIYRKNPKMSAFKNPVPLQFLKVLPEVTFCFQFDLKDSKQFEAITAEVKLQLFEKILTFLGTGAKTNVGYGNWRATR